MIQQSDLEVCPELVRRYLTKAGVVGVQRKTFTQINHDGEFRMKPKQRWFPIKGEYHFKPEGRSFDWNASIKIFPLLFISVKDEYADGVGRSLVKFESIFTIADQTGAQTSESSLGRLLVELILIPTALVPSENLHWESIDSTHARVVLRNCGFEADAILEFNSDGMPIKTSIDRFGNFDGEVKKNSFVCELSNFKKFEDLIIPTDIIGSWNLSNELFSWLHFKIKTVHYI